jgi:hypothetical protein
MTKTLLAAAVIALIPLAAGAAEGSKQKAPATEAGQSGSFDKNGDGYLDNAEYDNRTKPQQ